MKTQDLIRLLATDTLAVPRRAAPRVLALSLLVGVPLAAAVMLLGYGVRPDLKVAVHWPMFWMKLLFPLVLCAAAFVVLQRLARPGVRVGISWLGLAVPVLLLWALAATQLGTAAPALREAMVFGQTWRTCSLNIALISTPVFLAAFAALAGLAPTRPAWTGACAGAMAGGAGAAVYALHCPELAAPFLALWYVVGVMLPVTAGALLGPRLLRW
ncbi:MAG: DUF1109 domain-containing protein [Pseudomonadota bacterium]|nr:DUF1109 domain-containing protein [Pseudomonadota bacterium]